MFSDCPYRQQTDTGLICGLAKNILKTDNNTLYVINDDVCKLCYNTKELPDERKLNVVVANVLKIAALKTIKEKIDVDRANKLLSYMSNQLIYKPIEPCGCQHKKNMERNIGHVR